MRTAPAPRERSLVDIELRLAEACPRGEVTGGIGHRLQVGLSADVVLDLRLQIGGVFPGDEEIDQAFDGQSGVAGPGVEV